MSKKAATQTTTAKNTVDPMVSDMQQWTMGHAKNIGDRLNQGVGAGVAGWDADQADAFNGIRDMRGGITPQDVQGWLNPHTSQVVDTTTNRMRQEADRNLNAIRARGAAGSAFGGMGARSALAENLATRGSQQQIAEMTAKLMAQGYDQATATAITNQNLKGSALQGLLGIGNQQQAYEQQRLDAPLRHLALAKEMTPQQYSSTVTTTAPNTAPSPFQQVLGLAGTVGGGLLAGPMGGMATNLLTGRRPAEMVYS